MNETTDGLSNAAFNKMNPQQKRLYQALYERWQVSTTDGTNKTEVIADVTSSSGVVDLPSAGSLLGSWVKLLSVGQKSAANLGPTMWPVVRRLKKEMPPAVKDYVMRCFATCGGDNKQEKRNQMAIKLQSIIDNAIIQDTIWEIDWSSRPVPSLHELIPFSTKRKIEFVQNSFNSSSSSSSSSSSQQTTTPTIHQSWIRRDISQTVSDLSIDDSKRVQKRAERFHDNLFSSSNSTLNQLKGKGKQKFVHHFNPFLVGGSRNVVVGTSTELEKSYLRLTSAPDPSTIRPEHILVKALELLKAKLKSGGDYSAACEQWKSIRQDLTVQHIKGSFAIEVYESHGREALAQGDFGEFNQCQTQLMLLYRFVEENENDDDEKLCCNCENKNEFLAYRLLYLTLINKIEGLNLAITELSNEEKQSPEVSWASIICSACNVRDYHSFFKKCTMLQKRNLGNLNRLAIKKLVSELAIKIRDAAIRSICMAYRPSVTVSFIQQELSFPNSSECIKFLHSYSVVLINSGKEIDTKSSMPYVSRSQTPETATPVIF